MEVTKLRFPHMTHVGDITKLNGATLPPVDVICGGSPCQDLSIAGRRAGLAGERSGLFMEQVRIVKEMRAADERRNISAHLVRPRYLVWENVPGAFSSADGEDFRAVLEEIVRIKHGSCHVPQPESGRWESAGVIVLGNQFSLAWRVLDAQYWGVAQRRRRIFLVADLGGKTAPQILFKQNSLFGDSASCDNPWERPASPAKEGAACSSEHAIAALASTNPEKENGIAFAANQRDEVRDLHNVAGALGAQPGMKQQTFVFTEPNCLNGWDTQQSRVFTQEGNAPTLAGADGGGGRNPAGLLLAAGFCAGAAPTAGGIGYGEEVSPTLKAGESGTNMVPSILCINDQGGQRMDLSLDVTGTIRAHMDGHPPLVMATQQGGAEIGVGVCPTITSAAGTSGNNQPVLFENHGIDSRYTGPHAVAPTMSARYGTGGNNQPLVGMPDAAYCIAGNAIDRQPHNGGNGIGWQEDLAYTLTAMDHHAVFSRQRVDVFSDSLVSSTQSARQYKDATDLICQPYQQTVGTIGYSDHKGVNNQFVSEDKCMVVAPNLIRRLTPLECERLQGFPDGWTAIPGASDSARYKALGNSVAIPCVEFVLRGIAYYLSAEK